MSNNSTTERDTIEALADSFVARFRAGQRPSVEEYANRYPELAEELRELLPALVLLEQNALSNDTAAFGDARKSPAAPREIGDFTIVREIGRGGMGVVYEAVQQSLGRHVALKVLSSPGLLNPSHLERFHLEARAAARLHHTHIVPVFGVGEHDGLHFYAMQFIQGQSLDLVIDELRRLRRMLSAGEAANPAGDLLTLAVAEGLLTGQFRIGADGAVASVADVPAASNGHAAEPAAAQPTSENSAAASSPIPSSTSALSHSDLSSSHGGREFYRSVARVGLQVAEALAYAHSEGILHRDIKPSNLLLDARGNVWITDFGLARDESSDGLTRTGDFVGTLRYMAPERLEGWSDRRSDLYSLGATLYELLTLKPFLETPGRGQLVDKILHENPLPPSKADPAIPRDLETIVLKAIGKEPASRYRSAEAMAEDLERFLADRTILARRSTPTERFVRWCRRNPVIAGLSGTVAALLVTAVVILAVSNTRVRRESVQKEEALAAAELNAEKAAAESKRAEDNFVRASIAIREVLTKAAMGSGEWSVLPAPLRKRLSEEAVKFYESMIQEGSLDPNLQYEAAVGHRSIGALHTTALQFRPAEESFRRSVAILDRLVTEHPETPRYRHQLAYTLLNLGRSLRHLQRPEEAKEVLQQAIELYENLLAEQPDSINYRNELPICYTEFGARLADLGDFKQADSVLIRGIAILEDPLTSRADLAAHNEQLGRMHLAIGRVRAADSRFSEARAAFQVAAKHFDDAFSAAPTAARLYGWSDCYKDTVELASEGLPLSETEQIFQHFLDVHARTPDSLKAHRDLREQRGHLLRNWAYMLWHNGRLDDAEQAYLESALTFQQLMVDESDIGKYWSWAAASYNERGRILEQTERFQDAEESFRRSLTLLEEYEKKFGKIPSHFFSDCAVSYFELAALLLRTGRVGEAAPIYKQGLVFLERSVKLNPPSLQQHYLLAVLHVRYGNLEDYRNICAAMVERFGDATSDFDRDRLAWTCALGPDALDDLNIPLEHVQAIIEANPQNAGYLSTLGGLLYRTGQFGEAAKRLEESIAAFSRDTSGVSTVIYPRCFLAMTQWQLDDKAGARQTLAEVQREIDEAFTRGLTWNRRATLELLRHESEALITPTEATIDVEDSNVPD